MVHQGIWSINEYGPLSLVPFLWALLWDLSFGPHRARDPVGQDGNSRDRARKTKEASLTKNEDFGRFSLAPGKYVSGGHFWEN